MNVFHRGNNVPFLKLSSIPSTGAVYTVLEILIVHFFEDAAAANL